MDQILSAACFGKKVLLEYSHIHLCIESGCFGAIMPELGSCCRDHMAHKAENVCYLVFYRKGLLISHV